MTATSLVLTPTAIKGRLHAALEPLTRIGKRCALLDYPHYLNLGDHSIWLGSLFYLTNELDIDVAYAADIANFSPRSLEQQAGDAPIVFNGGGNLGDTWPEFQQFREEIIDRYVDRPIFILPQTVRFRHEENAIAAAKIFNNHPDLTLFVRDRISYQIACEYFHNCRVYLAPDMALQLVDVPGLDEIAPPKRDRILYLFREDSELDDRFAPSALGVPNLDVEDWVSFGWKMGHPRSMVRRAIAAALRDGWMRGIAVPQEWKARRSWLNDRPYTENLKNHTAPQFNSRSWSFLHSGIYQLKRYNLIITNRLHGHLLCVILGIPHVFLPNSYYKNEQFYQAWTKELPFCRFVTEPDRVAEAVEELRSQLGYGKFSDQ